MLGSIGAWLDQAIPLVFWTAVVAFVAINGLAVLLFLTRRSRDAVNKWTAPLLAANLLVVGVGTVVPATMYVAEVAVSALASSAPTFLTITE